MSTNHDLGPREVSDPHDTSAAAGAREEQRMFDEAEERHRQAVYDAASNYDYDDTPPPPVAGADARETTRELSEAELDAIDARAKAETSTPEDWRRMWGFPCAEGAHIGGLDSQTVRALVAMARRAKP